MNHELMIAYKPFMEFKYGATVGKMALKIKIMTIDKQGITFTQSLIRSLPWLLSGAISTYTTFALMTHDAYMQTEGILEISQIQQEVSPMAIQFLFTILFLATVITVAFDGKKRGLHDMLAKTFCFKVD